MYQTPLSEEDKAEIIRKLKNDEISPEEFAEIAPLLQELKIDEPIIHAPEDENDPPEMKMIKEYMRFHGTLPKDYDKIPVVEIKEKGQLLFDPLFNDANKRKEVLILLAHHGTQEALEILENFVNIAEGEEILYWTMMAIDECRLFLAKEDEGELPSRFISF